MTLEKDIRKCPCGSGKNFSDCCEKYLRVPGHYEWGTKPETVLFDWLDVYSQPIVTSFMEKARPYVFRISSYLDSIIDQYFTLEFDTHISDKEAVNKAIFSIQNNILHSLLASFSCSCQGLFMQSGILLRSLTEDCLVLVDFSENKGQIEKFLRGNYSTSRLLSRVKAYVPQNIVNWYSYFSENFTHFGPLHPAPYLPIGCYADNAVLVIVLQNMVRAVVTFHTVLERIHFNQIRSPVLWNRKDTESVLIFCENSPVLDWADELGKEIISDYPPDERKEGFFYDPQGYRTK
ncbi:SEC-C metal-binding domain-containing protein [Chloroflexota bacterium]